MQQASIVNFSTPVHQPAAEMQFPLHFGFYVLGSVRDLDAILDYCQAVRLSVHGSWHKVSVEASRATAFLKVLDAVPSVEGISGVTANGRVPLKDYLAAQGLPLKIPV